MAGEIQEPISFQVRYQPHKADSLHSGSISFGRFETESLSWERRSSFSHNRYLEEVEKYSTPGSVTQKKAYFEAHFKKKALLRQASSVCQSGMEYKTNENDILDNMSYMEEFDHANEGSYFAHYGENLHGSDYHGECDVMGFKREHEGISSSKFQMEPVLTNVGTVLDDDLQHLDPGEMHQTQPDCITLPLIKDEPKIEVNKLSDEAENVNGLPKSTSSSPKSHIVGINDSSCLNVSQKPAPKVTAETKTAKPKLRAQVPRKVSSEVRKDSAKSQRKMERETPLRTKTEKRSPQKASPTMCSLTRTLHLEFPKDPKSLKDKLNQDNRSEKDPRAKKVSTKPQPSASEKGESIAYQSASRPKRTVTSTRLDVKPSSAVFNFKSDERAEKRKEFYTKLEAKMHAKEVEMNQIQARTHEETEAEIKQFRRRLNFKATLMPSFYHESVPQSSDEKKAVASHVKTTKLQSKSTSPGITAAGRSPAFSKAANQQGLSANESANTTAQPQTSKVTVSSEAGDCSPTALTNRHCSPQAGKRIGLAGKKERDKSKDSNMQKLQGTESDKAEERVDGRRVVGARRSSGEVVRKGMSKDSNMQKLQGTESDKAEERVDGRRVVGARRSSGEVVRKGMKGVSVGIGFGGSSGMARLAVNVAS